MVEAGHPLKHVTTKEFTGAVVDGILRMKLSESTCPARLYIPVDQVDVDDDVGTPVSNLTEDTWIFTIGDMIGIPDGAPHIPEHFRRQHLKQSIPKSTERQRARGDCKLKGCKQRPRFMCVGCNRQYCVPEGCRGSPRFCFYMHVAEAFMRSGYAGLNFKTLYDAWRESIN